MLEMRGVFFSENYEEIFKNLNFSIQENSIVGLFGKSGSGKTTLARLLTRVKKPQKGKILLYNKDIQNIPYTELSRQIQLVFQDPGSSLNPMQKCKDILSEPATFHKIDIRLKHLLQSVNLEEDVLEKYPFNLSGGQKQKIAIARALSLKPRLLICDEATASCDLESKMALLNTLEAYQQNTGASILLITHEKQFVRPFCDHVYHLNDLTIKRID